ncbi:MAG: aldehyde dehydrogenase family protein, partial [Myxococcota bacterium]|nr:aldehyde dehydrogenase family protein [Myxococcota bacterium]
ELGRLLTAEMGKPLREAVGEVRSCGSHLGEELDEMVGAFEPELLEDGRTSTWLCHDPLGVAAAITPWNFPISMPHWMVLPALMAGNTVVLKPSEETPLIAQAYTDLLASCLPEGVLSVIHGDEAQGKALVQAEVDLIAFTGSRHAGSHILGSAAEGLKRVILELGGKDPLVVLDDADLEKAAKFAVRNSFRNAGQVCVSTERIYVLEPIADRFEEEVARLTTALKVGDGSAEGVEVGPMVNAAQRDHVLGQIDDALRAGARLLAGGKGHQGNLLQPTVLAGLDHSMDIMRRETFGPVACIVRCADEDEAVRLANDTVYGLGAVVFGGNEERAAAVARRIRAGMVGINRGVGGAQGSPWVGAKQSGFGYHGGPYGHRQFAQARIISTRKQG